MRQELIVSFRCGIDGEEWTAHLGPVGQKLGFIRFERPGRTVESSVADSKADLRRRLDRLISTPPPLPPPAHIEIIKSSGSSTIGDDAITDFGFECPSCGHTDPLLCPTCRRFSCQGAERDAGNRIQCQWCGTTLVFKPSDGPSDGPSRSTLAVEVAFEQDKLRARELPPARPDWPPDHH